MREWRGAALPFTAMGTNALAAYFLSSVAAIITVNLTLPCAGGVTLKSALYNALYASWAAPAWASFLYACGHVLFWTLVMMVLYRKKIFITA
jgi:predicted acyltransferase